MKDNVEVDLPIAGVYHAQSEQTLQQHEHFQFIPDYGKA
jgi:hypothetical protein